MSSQAASSSGRAKSAVSSEREAREKLDSMVYDYLLFVGAKKSALSFQNEVGIDQGKARSLETPGFLFHWWTLFWDLYSAVPERRDSHEPSIEARHFMDMMQQQQQQVQQQQQQQQVQPQQTHPGNGVQTQSLPYSHPGPTMLPDQHLPTPMAGTPHAAVYTQMHAHQSAYNPMPMSPSYMQHPAMRHSRMAQQQSLSMAPSPGQTVLQSPAMSPGQQGLSNMQRSVPSSLSLGPPLSGYGNPALRHGQAGNGMGTPGVMHGMNMVMSAGTPTGGGHPGTPTMARSSPASWQSHIQPHGYSVGPVADSLPLSSHVQDQNVLRLHAGQDAHLQDQTQVLEIHKMKQSLKDEVRPFEKTLMPDTAGDYFPGLALDHPHMHGAPG